MSMPTNSKIRIGIIGCGRVTETRHLPALRYLESVEVVALADISVDRLNKVADLFDIKARYAEYQRLLEEPSIDAVAVCVPAQFHVEIGLAALDAGKHILVKALSPETERVRFPYGPREKIPQ